MRLIEAIIERQDGFVLKCIVGRIVLVMVDLFVIDNDEDEIKVGDEMVVIDNIHGMEGADADNLDRQHPSNCVYCYVLVWLWWFVICEGLVNRR